MMSKLGLIVRNRNLVFETASKKTIYATIFQAVEVIESLKIPTALASKPPTEI